MPMVLQMALLNLFPRKKAFMSSNQIILQFYSNGLIGDNAALVWVIHC